jgi:sporulation protein YlmC with PRC-barrel domain
MSEAYGITAVALATALAVASPVVAQSTVVPAAPSAEVAPRGPDPRPEMTQNGPFITGVAPTMMRLSKVLGVGVIGSDPVRIGKIDDVLLDKSGRAVAVVIGTGGLLGLGEKQVGVPFDSILWNTADDARKVQSSGVVTAGTMPQTMDANRAADRMPGAGVNQDALNSQNIGRSGVVDGGTGGSAPARPAGPPATELVVGPGGAPEHAVLHLTKGDLQMAPAFRFLDGGKGGTR